MLQLNLARRVAVAVSWADEEARACGGKARVAPAVGVVQPRRDLGVKIAVGLFCNTCVCLIRTGAEQRC